MQEGHVAAAAVLAAVPLRRLQPQRAALVVTTISFAALRRLNGSVARSAVVSGLLGLAATLVNVFSASVLGLKKEAWPLNRWLSRREPEDAIDPGMPIIDPHHHLWDARVHPKGWPVPMALLRLLFSLRAEYFVGFVNSDMAKTEDGRAVLNTFGPRGVFQQPYMAKELLRDIAGFPGKSGHNICATVYLECGWADPQYPRGHPMSPVGEAAMATAVHSENPRMCNGIVAHADLRLGQEVEPALQAYSKNELVRGIRHGVAWTADKGLMSAHCAVDNVCDDAKFREGFKLLGKYGLSFDVWMYHEQLPSVTRLARDFPDTTIIIDHVALPLGISSYTPSGSFASWRDGMKKLSECKNVYVKLSGLAMRVTGLAFCDADTPPTSGELALSWGPYINHCISCFGVDRCMFASNFPVDRITGSYTTVFNAFKRIVADRSPADKHALFFGTAKKVYRLSTI